MMGRIQGIETLGGADGPGVRTVVFMQGCHLRCIYCHNPETWDLTGGEEIQVDELYQKMIRFKPYFGSEGGVTLSGGEPLLQPLFALALFRKLNASGISTALDTAGVAVTEEIIEVLKWTNIVLIDLKGTSESQYHARTGGSLETTMTFLKTVAELGCRIWLRHVVVPGLNDTQEAIKELYRIIQPFDTAFEKVELLGYHRLGVVKYQNAGMPYVLKSKPSLAPERLKMLQILLEDLLNNDILYNRLL